MNKVMCPYCNTYCDWAQDQTKEECVPSNEQNPMKSDNPEESPDTDLPISKGLSEVGSRAGNNGDRPLVEHPLWQEYSWKHGIMRNPPVLFVCDA